MKANNNKKILVDLRPAFEGYGGIPQESRLLFLCLRETNFDITGLINHPGLFLSHGLKHEKEVYTSKDLNIMSRVVSSTKINNNKKQMIRKVKCFGKIILSNLTCGFLKEKLTYFEPAKFQDFVWKLFSKTLSTEEYEKIINSKYKVLSPPWYFLNRVSIKIPFKKPAYLTLNTSEFDVLIAQEYFPFIVNKKTKLIIRFHDAIPFYYPHLISTDVSFHRSKTYYGIKGTDKQNAFFVCVSNQVKNEILSIIPHAVNRVFTIYDIVAPIFYKDLKNEESKPDSIVSSIVLSKINIEAIHDKKIRDELIKRIISRKTIGKISGNYILIVSSIETRKNHLKLLSAFEAIKRKKEYKDMKLIVVGNLGPDGQSIIKKFIPFITKGDVFFINNVSAYDLKILYKYAYATVCPSIAEGFDYSGVEAMASRCPVIASDIPVHKEVYQDGCLYFNPYSTAELVNCILSVKNLRNDLIDKGVKVSDAYRQEKIKLIWNEFLSQLK